MYSDAEVRSWAYMSEEEIAQVKPCMDELTQEQKRMLPWYKGTRNLWNTGADYVIIFGGRSNGKSYDVLKLILQEYKEHGKKFVYVRRWTADIVQKDLVKLFPQELLDEIFGPAYYVKVRNHIFYLCKMMVDDDGKEREEKEEVGDAIAISEAKHSKGNNYPNVGTIFFDEFIDMQGERVLANEYNKFQNVLSTVKRANNVRVIMCANTVSKYSEYFTKLGINPDKIEQGEVKNFLHPNGKYKVAIEYCKTAPVIAYLVGNMTDSEMISKGHWEIPRTDEIPSAEEEKVEERLLCTMYAKSVDATLGIYVRNSIWISYENINGFMLPQEHEREFLVIRRLENNKKSSYFHLTSQKTLLQTYYHSLDSMLKDIKDLTDIDVKRELTMGRVFCDNMFTGDLFNEIWQTYSRITVRELL